VVAYDALIVRDAVAAYEALVELDAYDADVLPLAYEALSTLVA